MRAKDYVDAISAGLRRELDHLRSNGDDQARREVAQLQESVRVAELSSSTYVHQDAYDERHRHSRIASRSLKSGGRTSPAARSCSRSSAR
jgi:hypothetical protein